MDAIFIIYFFGLWFGEWRIQDLCLGMELGQDRIRTRALMVGWLSHRSSYKKREWNGMGFWIAHRASEQAGVPCLQQWELMFHYTMQCNLL